MIYDAYTSNKFVRIYDQCKDAEIGVGIAGVISAPVGIAGGAFTIIAGVYNTSKWQEKMYEKYGIN